MIKELEPKQIFWSILLLIVVPCLISAIRLTDTTLSAALATHFSLAAFPGHFHEHLEYLLFVPLGALIVTFFRFTLGAKVFGVFRPVLLAIAFKISGILLGVTFLILVLSINAYVVHPTLKAQKTPYFARVSVLLCCVVIFMLSAIFAGEWLHWPGLLHLAYFPIIALCLITESFSTGVKKEGLPMALKRLSATVLVGVVITLIAQINGVLSFLIRCPEVLVAQIGVILFIAEYLDFRLFEKRIPIFGQLVDQTRNKQTLAAGEI